MIKFSFALSFPLRLIIIQEAAASWIKDYFYGAYLPCDTAGIITKEPVFALPVPLIVVLPIELNPTAVVAPILLVPATLTLLDRVAILDRVVLLDRILTVVLLSLTLTVGVLFAAITGVAKANPTIKVRSAFFMIVFVLVVIVIVKLSLY